MKEKHRKELDRLAARGKLYPRRIIDSATNKTSPLHDCFDWDDRRCAVRYRLTCARQLVQEYEIEYVGVQCRRYVSLIVDRSNGGGYRKMEEVRKNKDLLPLYEADALRTCLQFLDSFESQYPLRTRLPDLFRILDHLRRVVTPAEEKTA